MRGVNVYLLLNDLMVDYVDLGEMILEYRDTVNDQPEYYWEDGFMGFATLSMAHMQAGFLGVYGNLMTCTVPHGFVARELVRTDSQVGTAGDDGMIDPVDHPLEYAIKMLNRLGEFSKEKCFFAPEVIYLKRKVNITQRDELTLNPWVQFPTYALLPLKDQHLSRRFTHLSKMTWDDVRYSLYSNIVKCIRDFETIDQQHHFEHSTYLRFCGIINDLLEYGQLVQLNTSRMSFTLQTGKVMFRRPLYTLDVTMDIRTLRMYPCFSNSITKRRRREEVPFVISRVEEGDIIECNRSRYVQILEDSGFLEELPEDRDIDLVDVFDVDLKAFIESGPEIRRYVATKSVDPFRLEALVNRPLERLHKRRIAVEDFERLARRARAQEKIAGAWLQGYFDHDYAEVFSDVLDYGDSAGDEFESYLDMADASTIGESLLGDFAESVSKLL
jgi:hypothetical protein